LDAALAIQTTRDDTNAQSAANAPSNTGKTKRRRSSFWG